MTESDLLDDDLLGPPISSRHPFFQRSDSTLCLGCPPPDPFNAPISESLPLADQPHLLQPNARREDLFGIPKQPITTQSNGVDPPGVKSPLELPPIRLGLSTTYVAEASTSSAAMNDLTTIPSTSRTNHFNSHESANSDYDMTNTTQLPTDIKTCIKTDEPQQQILAAVVCKNEEPSAKTVVNDTQNESTTIVMPSHIKDEKEPQASTSKEISTSNKRKLSDHSDNHGNIYMQLKKKNYYDQYEDGKHKIKREGNLIIHIMS